MNASDRLEEAVRSPRGGRPIALCPYLTAGWPDREGFSDLVDRVASVADAIEIGVPFSDPMADGVTIQGTSREALAAGVTLPWILESLGERTREVPLVLMSYLNPLLAHGLGRLVDEAAQVGVCGLIVPDLPLDEGGELRDLAEARGLGVVQLVTPVTPPARLEALCAASRGFVYAVTVAGTTGTRPGEAVLPYLDRVRRVSRRPVCAGFGISDRSDLERLAGHSDGAIVGSALLAAMAQGSDPVEFLEGLLPEVG